MIERVVELKKHIMELGDIGNVQLRLTTKQWEQAEELKNLLEKAFIVTKKLQLDDLTPGYFYRKWTGLKLVLKHNGGMITQSILASMKKRETELLSNDVILAAILVDPNHMELLDARQKAVATEKLIQLALRQKGLCSEDEASAEPSDEKHNLSSSSLETDSDDDMKVLRQSKNKGLSSINRAKPIQRRGAGVHGLGIT